MDMLLRYDWPGNIRELENLLERLAILVKHRPIGIDDLPPETLTRKMSHQNNGISPKKRPSGQDIEQALLACGGNVRNAARMLGISRSNFYNKINAGGIDIARFRSQGASGSCEEAPQKADALLIAEKLEKLTPKQKKTLEIFINIIASVAN